MNFYEKRRSESIAKLNELLARPDMEKECSMGPSPDEFDPWDMFPAVYGSYNSEFDRMAVEVLEDICAERVTRNDLASEMFREMLCVTELCEYGTSPRGCFASQEFKALLPNFIDRWRTYANLNWQCTDWDKD